MVDNTRSDATRSTILKTPCSLDHHQSIICLHYVLKKNKTHYWEKEDNHCDSVLKNGIYIVIEASTHKIGVI